MRDLRVKAMGFESQESLGEKFYHRQARSDKPVASFLGICTRGAEAYGAIRRDESGNRNR